MTQRTINLYDGLEALYYFDSDYFDGTTGKIKDKSGHGRHATAQGGPTVGVNGPNDFEAASFDGNDDEFDVGDPLNVVDSSLSVCVLLNPVLDGTYSVMLVNGGNRVNFRFRDSNEIELDIEGDSGNVAQIQSSSVVADTWQTVTGVYDGELSRLFVDEALVGTSSVASGYANDATENMHIGGKPSQGDNLPADVAFVGFWSRALSDSEIAYLNRLTAPRRTQL
jgi:hypothetical protein